jgi:16S rRNA G1207 methylase RsmC
VTLLMLIPPVRGQTRVEAMARTEPGTFSHGKLDLAARVLARYQEGH